MSQMKWKQMTREKRVREFVSTDWCKGQQMTALPRVSFVFLCSCVLTALHALKSCSTL